MKTTENMRKVFYIYLDEVLDHNVNRSIDIKCQEPEIINFMKWLAKEGYLCQKQ